MTGQQKRKQAYEDSCWSEYNALERVINRLEEWRGDVATKLQHIEIQKQRFKEEKMTSGIK